MVREEEKQTNSYIVDLLSPRPHRTIWTGSVVENTELIHQYMANSLSRESPEMDAIRQAVREAGIFIVLGYSERGKS